MKQFLTFDDVLILPNFSNVSSRKDVDLSVTIGDNKLKLPILSSNMDTVTGLEMAAAMDKAGGAGILHRFWDVEIEATHLWAYHGALPWISVGVSEEEFKKIYIANKYKTPLTIDVAHGAQKKVADFYKKVKDKHPEITVIVGNFATAESINQFVKECQGFDKKDFFKVGVGPGCFAGDTRILMADGSYKDIKDIKLHERVINKNGEPVEVIGVKFSGMRRVLKYKNNNFYKHSYATPDHQHWVGDYSTISDIQRVCLRKILDKKTKNEESKYKWKELKDCEHSVFLLPREIKFEMQDSFSLDLNDFAESRRSMSGLVGLKEVRPSYGLGYLFGAFLGDGCAQIVRSARKVNDKILRNTSGDTAWHFGKEEVEIAQKVKKFLKEVFNFDAKIIETKNMQKVHNRNNSLSRMFLEFGKRDNKHLPKKYLCKDVNYLKGIYDGLVDSDGSYCRDGRIQFTNTSPELIELFGVLGKIVNGYFPSVSVKKPTAGGLENCNVTNCKEGYLSRTVKNPEWSLTKEYQICRVYEIEKSDLFLPTYDIEVDCPTHSFIANNVIVHNSMCSTRVKTGIGMPQFGAIQDCFDAFYGINIISDGGCRTPGDIAKALAAGAKAVMIGGMLAGTDEAPGEIIVEGDKKFKKYRGSASKSSYIDQGKNQTYITAEGEETNTPYKGPVEAVLADIEGGLRSSLSYVGASNLEQFYQLAKFIQITQAGHVEGTPHGKGK